MGIQDRDYMRRSPDPRGPSRRSSQADRYDSSSADSATEAFLNRFLNRHPRFLMYVGLAIGGLVLIGVALAWFKGSGG